MGTCRRGSGSCKCDKETIEIRDEFWNSSLCDDIYGTLFREQLNESMEEEKISCTSTGWFRQLIVTVTANLSTLTFGILISWPSPVIKKLHFNSDEISWIASLMPLGTCMGPWLAGPLADKLGRRTLLLLNDGLLLIGWVMLLLGQESIPLLYTGRFLLGFAGGVVLAVVPVYVAEISTPSIRGALGTMFAVFLSTGNLLVYSTGPFMGYIEFGILCGCPTLIHLLLFFWVPESPYQLMRKGKEESAERALKSLRSKGEDLEEELTYIRGDAKRSVENSNVGFRELFTKRGNLKALFMACGLTTAIQLCGINAVKFYTEYIFDLGPTDISSSLSAIIISIVMVLSTLIAPLFVDRQGRRPILLISTSMTCLTDPMNGFGLPSRLWTAIDLFIAVAYNSIGQTSTKVSLGMYFLLNSLNYELSNFAWVPLTSLILYIIGFGLGLGPVTWTMVGELFSLEVKRVGVPFASSLSAVLAFGTTKLFILVVEAWGAHTAFFIFAACCAASVLFVLFILPETKGKTFEEIQIILNS